MFSVEPSSSHFSKFLKVTSSLVGIVVCVGVVLGALGMSIDNQNISERFESLRHPGDDKSANGRIAGYNAAWDDLQDHPLGQMD